MSKLQIFTLDTFHRHNPDWEIIVYTSYQSCTCANNYVPEYTGKDYSFLIDNMSHVRRVKIDLDRYGIGSKLHSILRSDILRYHLLYEEGGIWSDFDVIWLKPLNYLTDLVGRNDFTVVICTHEDNPKYGIFHNISILISSPGQELYRDIIKVCKDTQHLLKDTPGHQEYGTTLWGKLFDSSKAITCKYPGVVSVPYSTFFPYPIYDMERLYHKTDLSVLTDKVLCEHWFNGHALSKNYVNLNLFNSGCKCSMTELLKREGYIG
jgi:hypothetical protein